MIELEVAINIALVLTIVGLVAGCIRMFKGPSSADRVVSLDFLTVLMIAITSLLALQLDNAAYLDLGLALALIGFLATVAFARYVERKPRTPIIDPADALPGETAVEVAGDAVDEPTVDPPHEPADESTDESGEGPAGASVGKRHE